MAEILSDPVLLSVVGLAGLLVVGPTVWGFIKWLIPGRKVKHAKVIEQLKKIRTQIPVESRGCIEDVCRAVFEESLK